MFYNLSRYLASNTERVIYQFGISLRYVITVITLATLLLGGLSYLLQQLEVGDVLERAPLIILALITLYYTLYFLTTVYFVTDQKIYKREGIGFAKVTSAKHTEIDDMKVQQGFLEKVLFNTGTLKFNTPGSAGFEIILPRVGEPFGMKKTLYEAWNK
ncbi:PH domain-containing protein [bacterium]|nr:PH domain-containing protein [bacterium]NCQ54808.1 PH domain-containing protein [Candidatus Parcubacteria bacterium]NCS66852.1 PH domain-containing protein [Candidatus Peregrinibacteria bacterium]NCS95798.1 PH domain-containing protein [bacterium]